jgi:hypothetical protein
MSEAHEAIIKVLEYSPKPLAAFEMRTHPLLMALNNGDGIGENALCTRFSDIELKGRIFGAQRKGKRYWEWWIRPFTPEHRGELF